MYSPILMRKTCYLPIISTKTFLGMVLILTRFLKNTTSTEGMNDPE